MEWTRATLPVWARRGHCFLTRWDGGPLEVEKGRVSGWPGYDRDGTPHLVALRDWYRPLTLDLALRAGYDVLWVTWSVGFSLEHERPHQRIVEAFIRACHARGVRAIAYLSLANMMREEFFAAVPDAVEWAARDGRGELVPYGAARYAGSATRVMARVDHPGWQERYLLPQVEAAVRAGADGVVFDNTFADAGQDAVGTLLERVWTRMRAVRPEAGLVLSNYNRPIWHWGRLQNALSTEDAAEPGTLAGLRLPSPESAELPAAETNPNDAPPRRPPRGVSTNIGLLQVARAVAQWRPSFVEYGGRLAGGRFTRQMAPDRARLAAAECAAFGSALELYVEPQCAALSRYDRESVDVLDAVGAVHRFLREHSAWYEDGWESLARVAVLECGDYANASVTDALARAGVLTTVLLEQDQPDLRPYEAVVLIEGGPCPQMLREVEAHAARGCHVLQLVGPGHSPVRDALPFGRAAAAELADACRRKVLREQEVTLSAPDGVVMAAYARGGERTVHVINYAGTPARVRVASRIPVRAAVLHWPEGPEGGMPLRWERGSGASFTLEGPYAVVECTGDE